MSTKRRSWRVQQKKVFLQNNKRIVGIDNQVNPSNFKSFNEQLTC